MPNNAVKIINQNTSEEIIFKDDEVLEGEDGSTFDVRITQNLAGAPNMQRLGTQYFVLSVVIVEQHDDVLDRVQAVQNSGSLLTVYPVLQTDPSYSLNAVYDPGEEIEVYYWGRRAGDTEHILNFIGWK